MSAEQRETRPWPWLWPRPRRRRATTGRANAHLGPLAARASPPASEGIVAPLAPVAECAKSRHRASGPFDFPEDSCSCLLAARYARSGGMDRSRSRSPGKFRAWLAVPSCSVSRSPPPDGSTPSLFSRCVAHQAGLVQQSTDITNNHISHSWPRLTHHPRDRTRVKTELTDFLMTKKHHNRQTVKRRLT